MVSEVNLANVRSSLVISMVLPFPSIVYVPGMTCSAAPEGPRCPQVIERRYIWGMVTSAVGTYTAPYHGESASLMPFLDHSPILLREDEAATALGATGTGLFHLGIKLVAIIKGQLLAGFDVSQRHNPDDTGGREDFTIRSAGMVDIAGFIAEHLAVEEIGRAHV